MMIGTRLRTVLHFTTHPVTFPPPPALTYCRKKAIYNYCPNKKKVPHGCRDVSSRRVSLFSWMSTSRDIILVPGSTLGCPKSRSYALHSIFYSTFVPFLIVFLGVPTGHSWRSVRNEGDVQLRRNITMNWERFK
jgi:hypothetical protein